MVQAEDWGLVPGQTEIFLTLRTFRMALGPNQSVVLSSFTSSKAVESAVKLMVFLDVMTCSLVARR